MTPTILTPRTDAEFLETSVSLLTGTIRDAIEKNGRCILGLSGGSTPKPIYEALGREKNIDWSRVHLFLVDDRYVPADHPDSNQKLIAETLLKTAKIPQKNLVFPHTTLPLQDCIDDYDTRLTKLLLTTPPDLITLGLGEDGHIASLFPPVSDEAFGDRYVIHTTTDKFAVHDRISVTFRVLRSARGSVFFLKGTGKKKVWEEMIKSPADAKRWPAQSVCADGAVTVIEG